MKNFTKNLNFYKINKKFVSNKLKPSFKNTTIIKLKTKEYDDWSNIASIIANNFRMKNSSQVYTSGQNYLGYLEFEGGINQEIDRERINQIIQSYAGMNDFILNNVNAGVRLVSSKEARENVLVEFNKGEVSGKKCSIFNNNKNIAGVVSCKLKNIDEISRGKKHVSDEFGYIIDNLEKNHTAFEIIEIQGMTESVIEPAETEALRVNKLISLIKSQEFLKHKLISVYTAEKSLTEGADIINDPSGGTFDPNLLKLVGENNVPLILSAFADQQRQTTSLSPIEVFINSLNRRLTSCMDKGILNSNIAIDLNLEQFTKKFLLELYNNLDKVKNTFDNVLMSSYDLNLPDNRINQIVQHLINNKISLIRHDGFRTVNDVDELTKTLKTLEEFGQIFRPAPVKTGIHTVEEIPRFHFSQEINQNKANMDEILVDESQVKKDDELSIIIKKFEESNRTKNISH